MPRRPNPFAAPPASAKAAALRYVSDQQPGLRRRRSGAGWTYLGRGGRVIRKAGELERIRALAIPPAWTDVWISSDPSGHLQATGRDARGRKQYRYHRRWRETRDETKYERMGSFGAALPGIRAKLARHLASRGPTRRRLLATVVRLLETTLIRVGNEEYAKANNSFGLTTLKDRHVDVAGQRIRFRFRGKSGKTHDVAISDARLARLVKRARDLPGQDLFQYLDQHGKPQHINSADVNTYIRDLAGEDFTAKDFRTWAGTCRAAVLLSGTEEPGNKTAARRAMLRAIASVADDLGNTPAICRKSYIHPSLLRAFEDPEQYGLWKRLARRVPKTIGLNRQEAALLRFLARAAQSTNSK